MAKQTTNLMYTIHPEVAASFHDHGVTIMHTGKGRLFTSNDTGAHIWQAMERRLSIEAIAKEISERYRIALGVARDHTTRFLRQLEQQALIYREAAL